MNQTNFPLIDVMDKDQFFPGHSIDCVILGFDLSEINILILKWKTLNWWALPGGFIKREEDMDQAAIRILEERTGLQLPFLQQFFTFGNSTRGERTLLTQSLEEAGILISSNLSWLNQRFVSTGYLSLVDMRHTKPTPDVLSESFQWKPLKELPTLILDHQFIIQRALLHLKNQLNYLPIGISLLPEKFTMRHLQTLYESVLQKELDRANFQKKMLKLGILNRLEKQFGGGSHKAPYLYAFNKEKYSELLEHGIGFIS